MGAWVDGVGGWGGCGGGWVGDERRRARPSTSACSSSSSSSSRAPLSPGHRRAAPNPHPSSPLPPLSPPPHAPPSRSTRASSPTTPSRRAPASRRGTSTVRLRVCSVLACAACVLASGAWTRQRRLEAARERRRAQRSVLSPSLIIIITPLYPPPLSSRAPRLRRHVGVPVVCVRDQGQGQEDKDGQRQGDVLEEEE